MRKQRTVKVAFFSFGLVAIVMLALLGIEIVSYRLMPQYPITYEGDNLIAYDPELGYVPLPNGATIRHDRSTPRRAGLSYHIYTNPRSARVGVSRDNPDRIDVATIGCSMSWGHGIESEQTFTSLIGKHAVALNFAMASFGTVQSLQTLKRNLDLKPKLVIYGFYPDHLRRNITPCAGNNMPFCLDKSYVTWDANDRPVIAGPTTNGVRRLAMRIKAQTVGLDPIARLTHGVDVIVGLILRIWGAYTQPDERREEAFLFLLTEMKRAAESAGAKLLVVHIPDEFGEAPEALLRSVNTLDLPLVDMTPAFRHSRDAGGPDPYIVDDGHLSAEGQALVAKAVLGFAVEHKLISVRSE